MKTVQIADSASGLWLNRVPGHGHLRQETGFPRRNDDRPLNGAGRTDTQLRAGLLLLDQLPRPGATSRVTAIPEV